MILVGIVTASKLRDRVAMYTMTNTNNNTTYSNYILIYSTASNIPKKYRPTDTHNLHSTPVFRNYLFLIRYFTEPKSFCQAFYCHQKHCLIISQYLNKVWVQLHSNYKRTDKLNRISNQIRFNLIYLMCFTGYFLQYIFFMQAKFFNFQSFSVQLLEILRTWHPKDFYQFTELLMVSISKCVFHYKFVIPCFAHLIYTSM